MRFAFLLLIFKYALLLFFIFPLYHFQAVRPALPFATFKNAELFLTNNTVIVAKNKRNFTVFPLSFNPEPSTYVAPRGLMYVYNAGNIQTKNIDGDVLIFADDSILGAGHYYHFIEHLLGTWNFLTYDRAEKIKTILFCFTKQSDQDYKWSGNVNEINLTLLKALYPNANIIGLCSDNKKTKIIADNLHISSRVYSHTFEHSGYDNFHGDTYDKFEPMRLKLMRDKVFAALDIKMQPKTQNLRITYCKRNVGRTMQPDLEQELLTSIAHTTRQPINVVDFSEYSFKEQLQIIANTDLLIGVHGNGLTHLIFLPDHAAVIEYHDGPMSDFYLLFAFMRNIEYHGNSHKDWTKPFTAYIGKSPQGNVTEIDLPGTLNIIRQLQARN